ncbi:MAG TPA: CsbD family protein [Pyrinomonadaceae bacterium]|jgi:uncharacterized protein YjbJ (UPF0337 family)|nr:CsbD family protein [Pyrinomonadaceae bacterium]
MALPNNDEVEGKWEQTKGSVKEGVGNIIGDRDLESEGQADQAGGDLQEGWGKVKRGVGETVDKIGDAISGTGDRINR